MGRKRSFSVYQVGKLRMAVAGGEAGVINLNRMTGRAMWLCFATVMSYVAVRIDRAYTGGEYVWLFCLVGLAAGVGFFHEVSRPSPRR